MADFNSSNPVQLFDGTRIGNLSLFQHQPRTYVRARVYYVRLHVDIYNLLKKHFRYCNFDIWLNDH